MVVLFNPVCQECFSNTADVCRISENCSICRHSNWPEHCNSQGSVRSFYICLSDVVSLRLQERMLVCGHGYVETMKVLMISIREKTVGLGIQVSEWWWISIPSHVRPFDQPELIKQSEIYIDLDPDQNREVMNDQHLIYSSRIVYLIIKICQQS